MIICLCGSFKFYHEIQEIKATFTDLGVNCLAPSPFEFREESRPSDFTKEWLNLSQNEKLEMSRKAEIDFLLKIDKADSVYIVNPTGYIGASVTFEIGYAFAKKKPIYTLEWIDDITVMSLIDKVLSPRNYAALFSKRDIQ